MRYLLIAAFALVLCSDASAAGIRHRSRTFVGPRGATFHRESTSAQFPAAPSGVENKDPLACLNAQRARQGLPPFLEDPALTAAAKSCAQIRARSCVFGHINDFAHVPPGARADSAGCGCFHPGFGFMACNMDSREFRFAGAAWARGPDGRIYCHLFVRR